MNVMVAGIKKLILATARLWDPLWIFLYRTRFGEKKPIPPFKNRDRIGARNIGWFMQSGFVDFTVLKTAISTSKSADLSELAILDFGAGCGRILQYFVAFAAELYASDVDPTAVQYLQRAYPAISCQVNHSLPPLRLPDDALDVVYAFSVWTHLPIKSQLLWLREMQRILRPQGILLISFLGFHGLKLLRESNNPHEAEWRSVHDEILHREGVLYKEYGIFDQGAELFSGITDSYGVAVHAPGYIRREWAAYFEIVDIQERAFHGHHDLVILRKR